MTFEIVHYNEYIVFGCSNLNITKQLSVDISKINLRTWFWKSDNEGNLYRDDDYKMTSIHMSFKIQSKNNWTTWLILTNVRFARRKTWYTIENRFWTTGVIKVSNSQRYVKFDSGFCSSVTRQWSEKNKISFHVSWKIRLRKQIRFWLRSTVLMNQVDTTTTTSIYKILMEIIMIKKDTNSNSVLMMIKDLSTRLKSILIDSFS